MESTVFSVRPKPLPGESFWGYVLRLANENGIPVLAVLNSLKIWEQKYVQRADFSLLDVSPGSIVDMEKFSGLTGHNVQKLLHTTFHPLLIRFGVSEDVQRTRFMSGMILDSYRFCPLCLKETPYYRLLWKMSPVIACVEHKVYLVDKCPSCNKQISFRDVELLSVCPHCGFSLIKSQARSIDGDERKQQCWINESLCTLLEPGGFLIAPPEVALRLLYQLCGQQSQFNRKLAEEALPSVLPTLLQHARDSLSQKRTLHLSFLLKTLYEYRISMYEFLQTTVPERFLKSVRQGVVRRAEQLFCLAPWCNGYQQPGTLVKTGTTLKRRKSGEILLYYLACTECECEYAIDEDGELQERTYFIEGYQALQNVGAPLSGIKELARSIGFSEDRIRRCLAYFCTRLQPDDGFGALVGVDISLLERVLNDIRKGAKLKAIQQWDCWESYQQFLVYRFHPEVMRALIELKRSRPPKCSDTAVKREKVRNVLGTMLERDEDITLKTVCGILGVCAETIRGWGCNELISVAKHQQRVNRLSQKREMIYHYVESFLLERQGDTLLVSEIYSGLGQSRTIMWRTMPDVSKYIGERVRLHNQSIEK